jgi:16S rRNA G966 N2-methylase RsmD
MQYRHTKEQDYSDFSSGRVLYSLPGHPAFPVRLASEIFQRCLAHRETEYGVSTPCTLYDPCCGAAYHLSVLAYLHGESIREIIASDIDTKAVEMAGRNLGLLSEAGLDRRIGELSSLFEKYGKESHREALRSAWTLKKRLSSLRATHRLSTRVFPANAMDSTALRNQIEPRSVDIVFTDVPYGWHSQWREAQSDPLGSMLESLLGLLSPSSILAIVSDKQQRPSHAGYQRLEKFHAGKRRVLLLRPTAVGG